MKKKNFCKDCGGKVHSKSIRCRPCWEKFMVCENNPHWEGGGKINRCIDCGKGIALVAKRCKPCRYKLMKGKNHPRWGGDYKKEKYFCIDCGRSVLAKRTKRCQSCNGKAERGKRHPNWQGGISRQPYGFDFDEELRELIRKRDSYKCRKCGCPQEECFKKLSIHHIDYNKQNNNPDNLIALCNLCHTKTNDKHPSWVGYFRSLVN